MPAYTVSKNININAPADKVRNVLVDFEQWPPWSPWMCAEPDCDRTLDGEAGQPGHRQHWSGEVIGEGEMELGSVEENRLSMDLRFLKPFKSTADVYFNLTTAGNNQTTVEWVMDSKLPFFMFFLKSFFQAMIGSDYRRGLLQLKDYVETGSSPTRTEVVGIVDVEPVSYVGSAGSSSLEDIGDNLSTKLHSLHERFASGESGSGEQQTSVPYTLYPRFNVRQQTCDYIAAIELPGAQVDIATGSDEFKAGNIASCKALKIIHTGEYRHLGNAWASGMMHMRAKKLKPYKAQPPFEKYISDPSLVAGPELVTEIYLPVR